MPQHFSKQFLASYWGVMLQGMLSTMSLLKVLIFCLSLVGMSSQAFVQDIKDLEYLKSLVKLSKDSLTNDSDCQFNKGTNKYLISWLKSSSEEDIKSGQQFDKSIDVFIERKSDDGPGFQLSVSFENGVCSEFKLYEIQY